MEADDHVWLELIWLKRFTQQTISSVTWQANLPHAWDNWQSLVFP